MIRRIFRKWFCRDEVKIFSGTPDEVAQDLLDFTDENPVIISVSVAQSGFHDNSGQFPAPNIKVFCVVHFR